MSTTRWQDIYSHLEDNNIEVYEPNQHDGDCETPYVVVKGAGASPVAGVSTQNVLYDLMCYVPSTYYSQLDTYVDSIKSLMKKLEPMVRATAIETTPFYDDTVKAWMVSVQYQNYKKL
jgi:hypothetical protein